MSFTRHLGLLTVAAILSACTQQPANYSMKGSEYYGRGVNPAYGSAANANAGFIPSHEAVQEAPAKLDNVGVSDLAPIQSQELPPLQPKPQAEMKPQSMIAPKNTLAEVKPVENKPVAESKPVEVKTVEVAEVKPVTKAEPAPKKETHAALAPLPEQHLSLNFPLSSDEKPSVAKASKGFIWPVEGKVISSFGTQSNGRVNDGINIAAEEGEPIYAAADGTVAYVGNTLRGYGNMAILRHDGGKHSAYAHAERISVKKGDRVKQGQIIGFVGDTGGVKRPQLHFAIREGKESVDPEKFLTRSVASN